MKTAHFSGYFLLHFQNTETAIDLRFRLFKDPKTGKTAHKMYLNTLFLAA